MRLSSNCVVGYLVMEYEKVEHYSRTELTQSSGDRIATLEGSDSQQTMCPCCGLQNPAITSAHDATIIMALIDLCVSRAASWNLQSALHRMPSLVLGDPEWNSILLKKTTSPGSISTKIMPASCAATNTGSIAELYTYNPQREPCVPLDYRNQDQNHDLERASTQPQDRAIVLGRS